MAGFALEYRWGPSANQFTSLLRSSSFVPTVGAWYTVILSVKQTVVSASLYAGAPTNPRAVSTAMFGGVAPVASLTTSDSSIGDGGVGMWVNGAATLDSFIIRGSCDAADSCGSVYDGGACHYGCSAGFYPTETASICGRAGVYVSNAYCRAFSPLMPPGQTFSVPERSPQATQAVPSVQVGGRKGLV